MAAPIPHPMREKLLRDEVAYTMSIKLVKSIEIAGMAKTAGYDGILVDMEHSSFDLETTNQLCVAALYAGISPIVRAPSKDPFFVSRILDGGALGIIVPHIRSVQDAQDVVNAAKFQPIGHRSSTNGLPHHQFRSIPAKISNPVTNAATMVIPMIETLEALELVDEIAALPGVDSLLIGTNDLTAEMGIPGDYENPRVTEAYERTIAACKKHGKWLGVGGLHARLDLVEKFCKMGARWVMAATDGPLLLGAATKRGTEMAALNTSVIKSQQANGHSVEKKATNGVINDLGVECIARSQQFDFNDENTTLTHARVNGYVESLRRRIAELEEKIKAAEQKHVQARHTSFGTVDVVLPINGKRRRSNYGSVSSEPVNEQTAANGEEQSSVQDTMSAIGLLSNKAMAESRTNTGDKPHKLAIIESISAALAVDGRDPSKASSSSQPAYVMDDQLIPLTRNLTLSPFHRFLDWSVWLPHIDENRLYEQYEAVLETSDQGIDLARTALPRFNTYLAVAIGISMSPDAGRLSSLASNLHTAAVKLLPFILHSQEPLDTLHCMLLLAVFSMFSALGGSTWHLMGFIMTNCIAAGLHKTAPPRNTSDSEATYRVEWLFWSVYLWDRSLASVMGRPFTITEVDISVTEMKLPQGRSSPLFSYSNLCFWREFPPQTGGTTTPTGPHFDYLDQLACRALILMVQPKDPSLTSSEADAESDSEVEADTISCCKALIERLYNRSGSGTTVSFLDAYDILAAAVAYICLVQRAPQPNQTGLTQTFEVVSKASILLTQCSSKFSALSIFQQFLLTLSTKMMEGQGSLQGQSATRFDHPAPRAKAVGTES
ncbi:STB5-SIN3 binding protein [Fusarium tjaetaba]|uniref:STB5-SIN3 binding protein n=1 Tax=Fusarium tjaetaba TaxID=1567544 RepID=A0A8H5SCX8_9HYPO|nr:STB5-SIN3 binding protein [Fusarium tjaetaba]KAF5650771.1 STB5-SIN3 binding protein [Fusarium tjaetaba]